MEASSGREQAGHMTDEAPAAGSAAEETAMAEIRRAADQSSAADRNATNVLAPAAAQGTQPQTGNGKPKETSCWTKARRALAIATLLAFGTITWLSFSTRTLHICDDAIARVGHQALVSTCKPLSPTDPPTLALLILAGILLLPELTSLERPGVIRVERQLSEQAKKQDDIVGMIHRLEIRQNQQVNVYTVARTSELVGEQDEKRRQFDHPS
jgi:hypothetical protein